MYNEIHHYGQATDIVNSLGILDKLLTIAFCCTGIFSIVIQTV